VTTSTPDAVAMPDGEDEGRMSLIEHLGELRSRLIKCVIAVCLGATIGFVLYQYTFDWLIHPYQALCSADDTTSVTGCKLLQTDPLEGFAVRIKISTYSGIALAMPVLLWQLWRFVSPGLYSKEKRYAIPFILGALGLFALGAGIAYWTMPKALQFLEGIGGDGLVSAYSPSKYLQLIVYMMLAFGIGFEFPIVLIALQLVGVVSPQQLASVRRYAIVGISVVVAVVTPSADPISMLALTIPMCIFYEVSIIIGRIVLGRRERASTT
jgi:sec-independent protein translocase protein TatC